MTKLKLNFKDTTSKLSFGRTKKELDKYLKRKQLQWDGITPFIIRKFTRDLIWTKFAKKLKLKPYIIHTIKYNILFLMKHKLGKDCELIRRAVNKGAKEASHVVYQLIRPCLNQADIFTLQEAARAAQWLAKGNEKHKIAGLMLIICFLTGARTGDLFTAWWETTQVIKGKDSTFWYTELRCGKNNKIPKTRQQLTIELGVKSTTIFAELWDWYVKRQTNMGLNKGKLFKFSSTGMVTYYYKKASTQLGFTRRITGHSGRNSTLVRLFKAGVNDTNINLFMRWRKDSSMIYSYRSTLLETTSIAAPHLLREYDEKFY